MTKLAPADSSLSPVDTHRLALSFGECGEKVFATPRRLDLLFVLRHKMAVLEALDQNTTVVLDLHDTETVDMDGLAFLVCLGREAGARGATLRLRRAPLMARRLLLLTGLATMVGLERAN